MTRRDNTMRMLRGALVGTAIAGGYALLCWLLLAGRVFAHEAPPTPAGPQGWCSVAGASDGRTICLFVPPRGF